MEALFLFFKKMDGGEALSFKSPPPTFNCVFLGDFEPPRIPCEFKCNFYVKPTKANLIQSGEYPSQCCILCIIMVSSKSQIPKSQTLTFTIKDFNRAEDKTKKSLSQLFLCRLKVADVFPLLNSLPFLFKPCHWINSAGKALGLLWTSIVCIVCKKMTNLSW